MGNIYVTINSIDRVHELTSFQVLQELDCNKVLISAVVVFLVQNARDISL